MKKLGNAAHIAYRLAQRFGHEWAHVCPLDVVLEGDAVDILNYVCAKDSESTGIPCPSTVCTESLLTTYPLELLHGYKDNQFILHQTGTGRLRWVIREDGRTLVHVRAKDEGHLKVFGTHVGDGKIEITGWHAYGKLCHRHLAAAQYALEAITEDVSPIVASISPVCGDDITHTGSFEYLEYIGFGPNGSKLNKVVIPSPIVERVAAEYNIPVGAFTPMGFPETDWEYEAAKQGGGAGTLVYRARLEYKKPMDQSVYQEEGNSRPWEQLERFVSGE